MYSERRQFGNIGETIACEFLVRHGFSILERNFLRKWGEIDIVAKKGVVLRFVEVKSVSCVTFEGGTRETSARPGNVAGYRPEENVHPQKLKRLFRTIEGYLMEKHLDDHDWQLDIVTVKINKTTRQARVELLENVVGDFV